jgi:TolB-like protein
MQGMNMVAGSTPLARGPLAHAGSIGERPTRAPIAAIAGSDHSAEPASDMRGATVRASLAFGRFVLQVQQRQLLADGVAVEIGSRAYDVLLVLAESGGALLTKAVLLDRVWPDVAVEENNLQVQISNLRRVLGTARGWIVTIPGRGYRFTAPVVAAAAMGQPADTAPAVLHEPRPLSVMVLPFAARGADPAQEWFVDGITDSLTTDLARSVPGCSVVAHATAAQYKGRPVDIRQIGQEQQVRFVLDGTVLLTENDVRVNAQLIKADTGTSVWVARFDRVRGGVLAVQDEIVMHLSRMAGLQMINAEAQRAERIESEGLHTSEAAGFIMRGLAAARQSKDKRQHDAACALYGRALKCEPDNVDALVAIAGLRVYEVVNGFLEEGQLVRDDARRDASLKEAEDNLERALALSPGDSAALKTRAVLWRARGRFADALAANAAILAQDPGHLASHRESGLNLLYLGCAEKACEWFRRADALAPGDPMRWSWLQGLGRALILLGRDGEAVEPLQWAVQSNPDNADLHAWLAAALALSGDIGCASLHLAIFWANKEGLSLDVFAQRSPVPIEATDPVYQRQNARMLEGLRLAAGAKP